MLITTQKVPPRISSLLSHAKLDIYRAARMSDAELLKIKGLGESALIAIRKIEVHVYYHSLLTVEKVRGCIVVIDPDKTNDLMHVLALISGAKGFAITTKGGMQIGLLRYVSHYPT